MSHPLPPFWEAVGFQTRLSVWMTDEDPELEVVRVVATWVARLVENPYLGGGVRQLEIAPNLWWARIPGTDRGGRSVYCSYWIDEEIRQVRCDQIATLSP